MPFETEAKVKRPGKQRKTIKMATNTIAAELLQQINLTKLRPNPNYLSATDAISVDEFEQTEYGLEYTLDTSNIQWEVLQMIVTSLIFSMNLEHIETA